MIILKVDGASRYAYTHLALSCMEKMSANLATASGVGCGILFLVGTWFDVGWFAASCCADPAAWVDAPVDGVFLASPILSCMDFEKRGAGFAGVPQRCALFLPKVSRRSIQEVA